MLVWIIHETPRLLFDEILSMCSSIWAGAERFWTEYLQYNIYGSISISKYNNVLATSYSIGSKTILNEFIFTNYLIFVG